MTERAGAVTFKGKPLTLVGTPLKVGDAAPDVELIGNDLAPVKLSSLNATPLVVVTVPSLDTPTCDTETRRFNQEATKLGDRAKVVVVSMDLPFAQKRWCGAAGVQNVLTLSDYRGGPFARASGLLIKELHLFARAILVFDTAGKLAYQQLVSEVSKEPDYAEALAAVAAAT